MRKNSGTLWTVTTMMIITFAGKALGLVRDSAVGSYFGTASDAGTAFNYASFLPRQFMDVLFSSAISASFIPVFNESLEKRGREEAFRLGHNFISVMLAASGLATLLCAAFAGPIIRAYDGGANPGAAALGAGLLRVMALTIVIGCLAFSLTGILQSLGEFSAPAAMGLACNAVILAYFYSFMNRFGVTGLCFAYAGGWLAQFLIQLPFLIKNKFKYRFKIDLKDPGLRRVGLLMLPVMVSTWVAPINALVNGKAAQLDTHGMQAFNALTYANTLYAVLSGVLVLSVANVVFPKLSVQAANLDLGAFGRTMSQTIRALFFLLLPMTFGLIGLSAPAVRLVYERGQFGALSTELTASSLAYFSAGICGFGLQNILTRGFYAFQEGKTPMLASILAIAANVALSFGLVRVLGVGGPALASSLSISISAAAMLWAMERKVKGIVDARLWLDLLKMLAIGLAMLLVVVCLRDFLSARLSDGIFGRLCVIALPAAAGAAVYMGLSLPARVPEALMALGILKNCLKRG